ncbi:MAG: hypothetical protein H7X77_06695, partial [Anaerolineae bacterium]|nr:hypothetical protein [Anaerolineae bacterium]
SVGISSDGITVLFAGVALGQTSPGNYVGSFDMGGSDNFQIYIAVQSASSMTGRLVGNTIFDGRGCSVTTYFSASR